MESKRAAIKRGSRIRVKRLWDVVKCIAAPICAVNYVYAGYRERMR